MRSLRESYKSLLTIYRAIVGALGCGQMADWLGRRLVVMLCLAVTFAAVTMEFVATTNELFFGGKFLNGFVVGALASVSQFPRTGCI